MRTGFSTLFSTLFALKYLEKCSNKIFHQQFICFCSQNHIYLQKNRSQTSQTLETWECGAGRDFQTCQIQSLLLQQRITMPFQSWSVLSPKSYLDFFLHGSYWVMAPNPIALMVLRPWLIPSLVYSWPVYIHLFSCQHYPLAEIALLLPCAYSPGTFIENHPQALLIQHNYLFCLLFRRG